MSLDSRSVMSKRIVVNQRSGRRRTLPQCLCLNNMWLPLRSRLPWLCTSIASAMETRTCLLWHAAVSRRHRCCVWHSCQAVAADAASDLASHTVPHRHPSRRSKSAGEVHVENSLIVRRKGCHVFRRHSWRVEGVPATQRVVCRQSLQHLLPAEAPTHEGTGAEACVQMPNACPGSEQVPMLDDQCCCAPSRQALREQGQQLTAQKQAVQCGEPRAHQTPS